MTAIKEAGETADLKYWLALNVFPKFGPARFKKLKRYFPRMADAFGASWPELMAAGIEENVAQEFIAFKHNLEPDKILAETIKEKISVVLIETAAYPGRLAEIYDPPPILYYKGRLEANEFNLAVVGSRRFSAYGRQATEKIVSELTRAGLTITSGLAFGIDALAHEAALSAGGRTIAVLGAGLNRQNIYPAANRYLAEKIINEGGLILSEFPLGTPPLRHHFPRRNRLISGLSLGTLVIEAGEKSGALITAKFALEQNREVFALPGSIYSPLSYGTNRLIKQGAMVVTAAADIIEALDLSQASAYIENKKIIPESDEEKKILSFLNFEPLHVDELVRLTGLNAAILNGALVMMEMKGMVRNLGGTKYVISK